MTCKQGHIVPEGVLTCVACAQKNADDEVERVALNRFRANELPLYKTSQGHLLPVPIRALTLCRVKRFEKPDTTALYSQTLKLAASFPDLCQQCLEKARAALQAPPQKGKDGSV